MAGSSSLRERGQPRTPLAGHPPDRPFFCQTKRRRELEGSSPRSGAAKGGSPSREATLPSGLGVRFMSGSASRAAELQIERLEPGHAEGVAPLSVEAGWNQIAADWRLMLGEGRAFGIRDASGAWIASALVLPLGPAISWISMVLVTRPARRQGLGSRLLQRCLAEIEAQGVAAGLDATELGRPVYLPLGFRDVYPLSRWRAEAGPRRAVDPPPGIRVRPATAEDLARIAACDQARSGFARGRILQHLLSRAPALARVAERADGGACRLRTRPQRSRRHAHRAGCGRR